MIDTGRLVSDLYIRCIYIYVQILFTANKEAKGLLSWASEPGG